MIEGKTIGVVIATYNGSKYIKEQIESIINQTALSDLVIVSDGNSSDDTVDICCSLLKNAGFESKLLTSEKQLSVVENFEKAYKNCNCDYVFFCDQDDVWLPDKVESVMTEIRNGACLVLHDASVTDADLNITDESYFFFFFSNASLIDNMIKNSFVGCCMAFTKELMSETLPFPADLPMHDWWIALVALKKNRRTVLLNKPLILWRRHGDNVTGGKTTFAQKVMWRLKIISSLARIK